MWFCEHSSLWRVLEIDGRFGLLELQSVPRWPQRRVSGLLPLAIWSQGRVRAHAGALKLHRPSIGARILRGLLAICHVMGEANCHRAAPLRAPEDECLAALPSWIRQTAAKGRRCGMLSSAAIAASPSGV